MTILTTDEVRELTDLLNERQREFGEDVFPPLSVGQVRLYFGGFEEWSERIRPRHSWAREDCARGTRRLCAISAATVAVGRVVCGD